MVGMNEQDRKILAEHGEMLAKQGIQLNRLENAIIGDEDAGSFGIAHHVKRLSAKFADHCDDDKKAFEMIDNDLARIEDTVNKRNWKMRGAWWVVTALITLIAFWDKVKSIL